MSTDNYHYDSPRRHDERYWWCWRYCTGLTSTSGASKGELKFVFCGMKIKGVCEKEGITLKLYVQKRNSLENHIEMRQFQKVDQSKLLLCKMKHR